MKLYYFLMIFLALISVVTINEVYAAEPIILVQTDDTHYNEGDGIVISGKVSSIISTTPVTLQIFTQGNLVTVAQITVGLDGSYSHIIIAEGPLWSKVGEYTVRVMYGAGNVAESNFSYTPKSKAVDTDTIFEVDAGTQGTFDVGYTIRGGATISDMVVDSHHFTLLVQIDTKNEGSITLDLPREFVGAEKQDGKDETFIILIDGIEVLYTEAVTSSDFRTITIDFESSDSQIEIIGTYIVPEFGTIAMMILMVGLVMTSVFARNKLQLRA